MKLTTLTIFAALIAAPVFAESRGQTGTTSFAVSTAESYTEVNTGAVAYNGGNTAVFNEAAAADGTENTLRVENAPALGGLALGGGHPCAYAPATAQLSIIGGGAGFGGMKVDSACMLMVMGAVGDKRAYAAANYMLAARDPDACTAMKAAGMVADCVGRNGRATTSTKSATTVSTKSTPAGVRCERNDAGALVKVAIPRGGDKAAALAFCKAGN